MNKLKHSTFYLVGPMDRVPDGGVGWRQYLTPILKEMGILVFNPCDKPIDRAFEGDQKRELLAQLIADKQYDKVSALVREFRTVDLRFVDKADCIICYLNKNIHTCGTYEEIFLANRQKKPVLIMADGGIDKLPLWLWGTFPYSHFFNSWDELIQYLHDIDDNTIEDTTGRWVFFNYERLMS